METKKLNLLLLPGKYAVCHFDANHPIPAWAQEASFSSISRTPDELSIICPEEKIPGGVLVDNGWRVFKVEGPFGLEISGIVVAVTKPLADAGISILNVSTYETDYLFVQEKNLDTAQKVLSKFHNLK
jgi:uncharacterized protein